MSTCTPLTKAKVNAGLANGMRRKVPHPQEGTLEVTQQRGDGVGGE